MLLVHAAWTAVTALSELLSRRESGCVHAPLEHRTEVVWGLMVPITAQQQRLLLALWQPERAMEVEQSA